MQKLEHIGTGAFKGSDIELLKLPEEFFKNEHDVNQAVMDMFENGTRNITVMCGDKVVYNSELRVKTNAQDLEKQNLGKDKKHIVSKTYDEKAVLDMIKFGLKPQYK